jgi:hypothetical protein
MTDFSQHSDPQSDQQMTQQVANSYVDHYQPPAQHTQVSDPSVMPTGVADPTVSAATAEPSTTSAASITPITPITSASQAALSDSSAPAGDSQSLEDQNIFFLLGVEESTEEEREYFLDQLQQVIWEDFVENDVELLLTEEELTEFKKIADTAGTATEEQQGAMIDFLEKLIPDLEKIMLEKAMELKEEMVRERILELTKQFEQDPDKLKAVRHASSLIDEQQWKSAAEELNRVAVSANASE